ncbi:MAG: YecA family protein, partial [Mesorhizobium sp.]
IYCVDKKGRPVLGKPRPGPETAHFIEHEAYKDIALVIPALRELHYVTRSDSPQ